MVYILKKIKWSIVTAIIAACVMIGGAIVYAQDAPEGEGGDVRGITYPIPELGNCASKEECHAYCDQAEHLGSCIEFGKSRGLMSKEEALRAEKFAAKVQSGEGPGGCNSPGSCKEFCEDLNNIDTCVVFAEKNEFRGEQYEQGKKMNEFLKAGGQMPGGCTSKASCEAYCSDFSHAEECFTFAQKAGITQTKGKAGDSGRGGFDDHDDMPTPEQFRKLAELTKNGETPGGCKSKKECEAYCSSEANFDVCIAFGEKAGFMSREEAEKAKTFMKAGGPGGCKSRQECESFCNNPANRETCFKFAEDNGFISKEEVSRAKEGMVRMRQGFEDAPPEVRECLRASLGTNIIEDIQSGKLTPGPEIGERMRGCFDKHGAQHNPRDVFKNAPPEVLACLKEKTGDQFVAIEAGTSEPTPEIADAFRLCFQQKQFEEGGWGISPDGEMRTGGMGDQGHRKPPAIGDFLRTAPPEVATCVKELLGSDAEKIASGEIVPTAEIGQSVKSCFQHFRPQDWSRMGNPQHTEEGMSGRPDTGGMHEDMMPPTNSQGIQNNYPSLRMMGWIANLPPFVQECMRAKLGEDALKKIAAQGPTREVEEIVRACQTEYGEKLMGGTQQGGMQEGMRPPMQGIMIDGKYVPSSEGHMAPPPSMEGNHMPPLDGSPYIMPPSGTHMPPPEGSESTPQSSRLTRFLLGAVFAPLMNLWGVLK